jgi:hypothetical protein
METIATEYCLIKLSGMRGEGQFAKASPERYEYLSQFRWALNAYGYAVRCARKSETGTHILMHRDVLHCSQNLVVDHIDGDRLNNCDWNLRLATTSQNNSNRTKSVKADYAKYQGVTRDARSGKWKAQIGVNGKGIHLGIYDSEDHAARVRDGAALYFHGEFAAIQAPHLEPIPYEPKPLGPSATKTSRFKGVGWHKSKNQWRAYHTLRSKSIHIGGFADEIEAAKARDAYLIREGVLTAELNFPNDAFPQGRRR